MSCLTPANIKLFHILLTKGVNDHEGAFKGRSFRRSY